MKILLVQPPLNPHMIGAGMLYLNEPLALETVAAGVAEQEVRIIDLRLEDSFEKELASFRPDIVGFTAYTPDVYTVQSLMQRTKRFDQRVRTVIGGHHATLFPEDFNDENMDAVVRGEGENSFRELITAWQTGIDPSTVRGLAFRDGGKLKFTPARDPEDLDRALLPARHLTARYRARYFRGKWRPVASIVTSRGCPYRCNFCSVWKRENGRYRAAGPERVVRELQDITESCISIGDDNFLHDVHRAEQIYTLIKKRGIQKTYKLIGRTDTVVRHPEVIRHWKEIGMEQIFLGLESFRDDFRRFNKTTSLAFNNRAIEILHGFGVNIVGQFIIDPDFTENDFEALERYVKEMRLEQPLFSVLTPLPGTDLYEERKNALLTHNYEMYDLVHSVLPTRLPRKRFYQLFARLFARCYDGSGDGSSLPSSPILSELYARFSNAHVVY